MIILHSWIFRSLYFYFIFTNYGSADWPMSPSSTVQLLGLFPDTSNTSTPTTWSVQSRAMFKAAILLSHQYNISVDQQLIGWKSIDTGGDAIGAFRSTCLMVSASDIVGIVGPAFSREAEVIAPFAKAIGIPVISYGATDPDLSDRSSYPSFYRTIPSDNAAALAIARLFIEFNWTSCVIIYQNDAFGSHGAEAIMEAFSNNGLTVPTTIVFDITTATLRGDLTSLLASSPTRIVLLWAEPTYTELVIQNALDNDVIGPQFTWILSSNIPLNTFNQTSYDQLIGILNIEAVVGNVVNAPINTALLNAAYDIWQQYESASFPGSNNVEYYALFAFDATWTLIRALNELCSRKTHTSSCTSFVNTSFCFDRQFLNSSSLFEIINNGTFLGVSGFVEFSSTATDRINGTYYVLKNVQKASKSLNYIPVFVWSDLNGWSSYTSTSVIVWPGNTLARPTGYAAISDITLRIAVVQSTPFTMITYITDQFGQTTTKTIGYMPDLIGLLQANMGFTANIITLSSDQSYDELIDAVANGAYDLVVADMTITAARSTKVGFSTSIFDNSLRIIIRQSSMADVDLLAYLRPFSPKLWWTLLVATIYAGLLIALLERHDNEVLQNRSISSLIGLSMWYSAGTILGFGVDFCVRTAAGRLLTVGLYIICLISIAAYTANLASSLTIVKSKTIISGIDDIKNGKIAFSRIGIEVGTAIEDYYLQDISGGVENFHVLYSDVDVYSSLLNHTIDVALMDAAVSEYATGNVYCNLTLVGADFARSTFGIVFQKNWQYAQQLDVNLLSLIESGALDDLKAKWFQTSACSESSDAGSSMSLEAMAGLYLTFAVITVLAFLLFLWTKRFILRNYLLIGVRSMDLLLKERLFSRKRSRQISTDRSSNVKVSLRPTTYL